MQLKEVTVSGGYQQLEIYQLALKLAVDIHAMTLTLPRIETYEEGSQIRRSSKSIAANIVEGYGRRQYKNEFLKYAVYASASCDETKAHLEILHQTGSLDKERYTLLYEQCLEPGKKIYRFRQAVMSRHNQLPRNGTTAHVPAERRILEEDVPYSNVSVSDFSVAEPKS
jgi:four helix bundle protein